METDIIIYIASKLHVLDIYNFLTTNKLHYNLYNGDYLWNYMGESKASYFFKQYEVNIDFVKSILNNTPKKRIINIDNAHFALILKKMVNSVDVTVNRLKRSNLNKTQSMDKYLFFKVYDTKHIGYLKGQVGGDNYYHHTGWYVPTSKYILVSDKLLDMDVSMQRRTIQVHIPTLVLVENYIINNIDDYIKFIKIS